MDSKETRGGKYGRFLAAWINYTINSLPEKDKENYRERLVKEIKKYSLEPRKKENL